MPMTVKCFDNLPHLCLPVPNNATKVFCQKCLTIFDLFTSTGTTIPPLPTNPPETRPLFAYTPNGIDDTLQFQNWINSRNDGEVWDIRGTAAINTAGVRVSGRKNVKITSTTAGGFKAIGAGVYTSAYASMFYGVGLTDFTIDGLKVNCNGKKAQGIYIEQSTRPRVLSCEVWGAVYDLAGPPYGILKIDASSDVEVGFCNVHDTTGVGGSSGVRGIWCGVGGSYVTRVSIHDCLVRNTGHTGIVVEGCGAKVTNNQVSAVTVQGTGYKFIPRGDTSESVWDSNLVDGTLNGGMMIEGSDVDPTRILITRMNARNVGGDGTTFGMLYVSGGGGTRNVEVSACVLNNCKRIANLNYAYNFTFKDNTVTNGPATIDLESNCDSITLTNSGDVSVGAGVTNVWVDGAKRA